MGRMEVLRRRAYYALTYIGIFVTIAVLIGWVVYENRRLVRYVRERRRPAAEGQR